MRDGFYAILQAGGDQDPHDSDAYGVAMLVHLKGGRFLGVDLGSCRVAGSLSSRSDGRFDMRMVYELKCGSQMGDGTILEADRTLELEATYSADVFDGAPQPFDIGFGPIFVRLSWVAEGHEVA